MSSTTTIAIDKTDKKRFKDFLFKSRSISYREAFKKLLDVAENEQKAEDAS